MSTVTQHIPAGWKMVNFNEFIELLYGSNLPKIKREDGSIPVYGSNGITDYHNKPLVKGPGIIIGRKGSIGLIHWSDKDFWPIDTTYYVTGNKNKNLRWIYYKLQTLGLRKMNTASGIPGLNRNEVYSLKIAIPPLPEQTKISAILSKVDEEIEKVEQIIEQTEKLKKGLTQKLLTKGIGHTKFKKTKLGEIPEKWEMMRGKDIATLITKGASPKWQGFDYQSEGTLFITSENVRNGYLDISTKKFLPLEFHNKLKNSQLNKNDILINIVGASIGRSCIFNIDFKDANINQAVCLLRVKPDIDPEFVIQYLQMQSTIDRLLDSQSGSARQNLSLTNIKHFPFVVPTLNEQIAIKKILNVVDRKRQRSQNFKNKLIKLKKGLMNDLLSGKVRVQSKDCKSIFSQWLSNFPDRIKSKEKKVIMKLLEDVKQVLQKEYDELLEGGNFDQNDKSIEKLEAMLAE